MVSTQGISTYWAKSILNFNTTISIISIILLTLTLLDLFTKKDKVLNKINFIVRRVINLIISFIILIISYSINVLSLGNLEQIW